MGIERVLLASLLIGCGYRPAAFTDAPPVLDARDEAPIAMPEERRGLKALYWTEAYIERGVIDTRNLFFFLSVIGFALFATGVIIRGHRAG